jgi:hypothetical protein
MQLPANKTIKDLLEGMLGRDVALDPSAERMSPIDAVGGLVATFCDDASNLRVILGWSIDAGAYVGCCLGLIPAGLAKEMIAEKAIRTDAVENLAEVSNVMAATFDHPQNPHVRMNQTYHPTGSAPGELTRYMFTHAERVDLELNVKGYGSGKMSLVLSH